LGKKTNFFSSNPIQKKKKKIKANKNLKMKKKIKNKKLENNLYKKIINN
jgi:hypothetical protein